MMANVIYLVVCFMCLSLQISYCQRDVGDFCTLQSTGAPGICQVLSDCPAAIQDLQMKGIYPQNCGFVGALPIVCCVGSAPPSITATTPKITTKATPKVTTKTTKRTTPSRTTKRTTPSITTKTTVRTPPTILRVGDKSKQKCHEYSQYVNEDELSPILLAGAGNIQSQDCAIVPIELIVGGTVTKPKEFPHMALIGFDGENKVKAWQCGGSLISEQYVLTAGHCLFDPQWQEPKYIRLGDLNINTDQDDAKPQDFNIIEMVMHPGYQPPSQYNDIALLKMDRPAILNPYVRPACLDVPSALKVPYAVASGWGRIGYTQDVSPAMLKVTLEFFTNAECNISYKSNIGIRLRNGIIEESQICAGSHSKAKDTCQGDSGGPLQIINQEEYCMYTIVGVTSFGKSCGVANIPGVYTRVSNFIEWIEEIVWS